MLYPFQNNKNEYGYINSQGEVIIQACYSYASSFSDGIAHAYYIKKSKTFFGKIKEETVLIFLNTKDEIIIQNKQIQRAKSFMEGYAMFYGAKEKKWGFIDQTGKIVIAPQFDQEYSSGFSEGLVDVCKNEKWGYVNIQGELVIPHEYEWTNQFKDGFAIVTKNRKKNFINTAGEKLKTVKCSIPDTINGGFKEGLAVVKIGKKYGAINTDGNLVIDPIYDEMSGFHNGLCGITLDGKSGFIDRQNTISIEPKFYRTSYFHQGICPATLDNKSWGLINLQGEFISDQKFDFIHDFTRTGDDVSQCDIQLLTRASIGKNDYYIDLQGNIIAELKDNSRQKALQEEIMLNQLTVPIQKEDVWDKALWSYDGVSITKSGAIKPIYFVLKWLKSNELLTHQGIACYKDKNNLEIGLYRFMVTEEAADFLDRYYKLWFETESICNFQIDSSLKFEGDENLSQYWDFYLRNKKENTL